MKGEISGTQLTVDEIPEWSNVNRMQLNADKCKALRILFAQNAPDFIPIMVENQRILEVVENVKLLGLNVSSNLMWNNYITEIIKKSHKNILSYSTQKSKRMN